MKFYLTLLTFYIYLCLNAQVGIGNTNPQANLDISASNISNPTNTDGVLIPRIKNFSSIHPTVAQDGMLVFATGNGIPNKGFYYWDNASLNWKSINSNNHKHFLGELFEGGIIFYVYANGQHGLIASLHDLNDSNGATWSGNTDTEIGISAQSKYNGQSNTNAILLQNSTPNKAATLCNSYIHQGFSDWYLPSRSELELLTAQYYLINKILENDGNSTTNGLSVNSIFPAYGKYISSTEHSANIVWIFNFYTGTIRLSDKGYNYNVRAIRKF